MRHHAVAGGRRQWYATWKAAYERAAAGGGQAHIVCVGDSITHGFYTDPPYFTNGWAGVQMTKIAARTGVTPGSGMIPLYDEAAAGPIIDDRTSRTGTWAASTAGSLYSVLPYGESGDTFTLGPITCSAFRLIYLTTSSGGAWTYTLDGGTPVAQTSNGADGVHILDISTTAGSHTLVLTATGKMFVSTIEAISNPTSGVKVSRLAYSGKQTSALIADANAISSRKVLLQSAPDLAIIQFGLNEASNSTSTATFQANLTSLVADFQSLDASVLILVSPPPNTTFISNWASYRQVMIDVAADMGTGLVDMVTKWGTYTGNLSYYYDNVHPNAAGHADMARIVSDFVVETVAPTPASTVIPTDISSLALWLDASDASTFTYHSGTLVSQWNDKSGNARHATQATSGNAPDRRATVNGKGAVVFDGVDNWMGLGDVLDLGTSNLSVFCVVRTNQLTNNRTIIGKYKVNPADGSWLMDFQTISTVFKLQSVYDPGTLATIESSVYSSLDTKTLGYILDRAAGTLDQRISKVTAGQVSFTPDSGSSRNITTGVYIGALRNTGDSGFQASYWFNGYICEIVVYLKAVNSTERDQIEAYLYDKWNLI